MVLAVCLGILVSFAILGTLNLYMRRALEKSDPGEWRTSTLRIMLNFWFWWISMWWLLPSFIAIKFGTPVKQTAWE